MRILVAEDDDVFRTLLAAVLTEAGYEVAAEPDGARAWRRLSAEGADLCVFDVDMPGMTGVELLKRLRASPGLCALPVILLTVKGLVEEQLSGYHAGADDYLPKPVEARVLLARVAALLRKSEGGAL